MSDTDELLTAIQQGSVVHFDGRAVCLNQAFYECGGFPKDFDVENIVTISAGNEPIVASQPTENPARPTQGPVASQPTHGSLAEIIILLVLLCSLGAIGFVLVFARPKRTRTASTEHHTDAITPPDTTESTIESIVPASKKSKTNDPQVNRSTDGFVGAALQTVSLLRKRFVSFCEQELRTFNRKLEENRFDRQESNVRSPWTTTPHVQASSSGLNIDERRTQPVHESYVVDPYPKPKKRGFLGLKSTSAIAVLTVGCTFLITKVFAFSDAGVVVVGVFCFVALLIHFAPSVVAEYRQHRQTLAIVVLNIFLGWTFIVWVIALIWACTSNVERTVSVRRI